MGIKQANHDAIAKAALALQDGLLVAFPTETVYGLGADARNGTAVAAIFEVKGRPSFNPLIVHVANFDAASTLATFNESATELANAFWPGALTLVLPRKQDCALNYLVSAGLDTIALRVPSHPVALELLKKTGFPIAAPSANRSGHISPTTADHVYKDLNDKPEFILDAGPTGIGIESTVIGFSGEDAALLRAGAITADEIEKILGRSLARNTGNTELPQSPGQLESHYAPQTRLTLDATEIGPHDALLAFGPKPPAGARQTINLSKTGDLREAAANLFASLRELDECGAQTIAVMPVPETGLGEAINDRLRRAAAPKSFA